MFTHVCPQMRDLQHDNVNGFVGACIEPPNVCALSEYCTRGSLKVNIGRRPKLYRYLVWSSPTHSFFHKRNVSLKPLVDNMLILIGPGLS